MGVLSLVAPPQRATFMMPDGVCLAADVHSPAARGAVRGGARDAPRAPLVLVHGTLVSRTDYRWFAPLLAAAYGGEVVVYDRRGRDATVPMPSLHSLSTEADDLDEVLRASGAAAVLGHSYGGTVTLLAAGRRGVGQDPLTWATYDAALNPGGALTERWRPEFAQALEAGRQGLAWAHLVQGLQTAGPVSHLPLPALEWLGSTLARTSRGGARMFAALPGSLAEMTSIVAAPTEFALPRRGLMLNGGASPRYFLEGTAEVARREPGVRHRVLPGLMHNGIMLPLPALARLVARYLVSHPGQTPVVPAP